MSFGLSDKNIQTVKEGIQKVFGPETDLKVYIFGSRASGKYKKNSDIDLAFKSKEPNLDKKILLLKEELENSNIPYKCDLVSWDNIIAEYLPTIKRYKKSFWSKKDAIIKNPWRMCPKGYHWVSEHLKEGNSDLTDSHCRKNRSSKDILKSEEIHKISELEIFKKPAIKASIADMGFKGKDKSYDTLINGWCAYWNDVIKIDPPLHPDLVKTLIATESSFNPNPRQAKNRTAIGLMQIMPNTVNLLSSRSKELKDHYLEISIEDVFDPNVNICTGIRWLFRKFELIKKKKKSAVWMDALEEYKGISNQSGKESNAIRKDLKMYYERLQ